MRPKPDLWMCTWCKTSLENDTNRVCFGGIDNLACKGVDGRLVVGASLSIEPVPMGLNANAMGQ